MDLSSLSVWVAIRFIRIYLLFLHSSNLLESDCVGRNVRLYFPGFHNPECAFWSTREFNPLQVCVLSKGTSFGNWRIHMFKMYQNNM